MKAHTRKEPFWEQRGTSSGYSSCNHSAASALPNELFWPASIPWPGRAWLVYLSYSVLFPVRTPPCTKLLEQPKHELHGQNAKRKKTTRSMHAYLGNLWTLTLAQRICFLCTASAKQTLPWFEISNSCCYGAVRSCEPGSVCVPWHVWFSEHNACIYSATAGLHGTETKNFKFSSTTSVLKYNSF